MNTYKILHKQSFRSDEYSIVPIRMEDRYDIMKWRNEQIYHLRQNKPLTNAEQDNYFNEVVLPLFHQDMPDQILFSFLENENCIGYGGLVHIDWDKQKSEVSFIINTRLEKDFLKEYMTIFFSLIDEVAFVELGLHKLYTYSYDVRPHIYPLIEANGFIRKKVLPRQLRGGEVYADVVIHEKEPSYPRLRLANISDMETTFKWATDPLIRKYCLNKSEITFHDHQKWFTRKIREDECEYYIFYDSDNSLGSIRFDIENGTVAKANLLVDSNHQGKGYGKTILEMGIELLKKRRTEVRKAYGEVFPENIASLQIVDSLGFQITKADKIYWVEKPF